MLDLNRWKMTAFNSIQYGGFIVMLFVIGTLFFL